MQFTTQIEFVFKTLRYIYKKELSYLILMINDFFYWTNLINQKQIFGHLPIHIQYTSIYILKLVNEIFRLWVLKNNLIDRALQEAQDIFGVDFDFDEFGYGEEDEFEEEDEVSLHESAQIECTVQSDPT